ncbi:MAG: type II toxin-antitoxin system RelE/ParE family toxin [Pseudolabrys sp.]|nr:type II toxin-antitoxin system RelE/ParE family toxin [Pseudolabrys sp.]MDP2293976.1 type II toxin-antitoxin system RelE/ParE family toxin [Pseudolabrys sp.]
MSLKVIWSPSAKDDLKQIWNYLAQEASFARADDQVVKIETACRKLLDFPFAGRSRDKLVPGLRTVVAAPYIVFYRTSDAAVDIVRVLDGRRNIDAILTSMP